ncbi:MAG TPA: hypothetical protein VL588_09560 [Bdellovibrionota bacterium]|nr:hypothetical protein [Bdellovibrionota bacterium]
MISLSAAASPTAESLVKGALPPALQKIQVGKSTPSDVRAALGRPGEEKPGVWHYDLGGGKFDTTIQFADGAVSSIFHRFSPGTLSFGSLQAAGLVGTDVGDPAKSEHRPHDMGREREASYPTEGIRLRYRTGGPKSVISVVLLPPNH